MIEHVDRAVERFFRLRTPLPEATAAISFETPDRDWGAARTRPTVNVFLWEIIRSPKALRSGMEQRVDEYGARQRRPVMPIVELHYLLTAWGVEPRDEHQLLGSLLVCILATGRLPDDVLSGPLSGMRCGVSLAPSEVRVPPELWNSLQGGPRAALHLEVSLPLEVFAWQELATPAEAIEARVADRSAAAPPVELPPVPLTRRRAKGAVVLEGRREQQTPVES